MAAEGDSEFGANRLASDFVGEEISLARRANFINEMK